MAGASPAVEETDAAHVQQTGAGMAGMIPKPEDSRRRAHAGASPAALDDNGRGRMRGASTETGRDGRRTRPADGRTACGRASSW